MQGLIRVKNYAQQFYEKEKQKCWPSLVFMGRYRGGGLQVITITSTSEKLPPHTSTPFPYPPLFRSPNSRRRGGRIPAKTRPPVPPNPPDGRPARPRIAQVPRSATPPKPRGKRAPWARGPDGLLARGPMGSCACATWRCRRERL